MSEGVDSPEFERRVSDADVQRVHTKDLYAHHEPEIEDINPNQGKGDGVMSIYFLPDDGVDIKITNKQQDERF